ncbi:unnamed protein product [Rhizoctonia solani]|uniref:Uncharacterized protein n=1 Tax=Rhizoctonia solani TaxID=456999 RepID=A0A8H2WFE0_9AGAM|nr:unnamed protein product [Rhizoctonia solani]
MGCIPSRSSMDVEPKPDMRIVARTITRGSSLEQFPTERPYSPASDETKVPNDVITHAAGAPRPPRVDCIAPRPSNETFKRRRDGQEEGHQESTTATAMTGSAVAGAAVNADDGAAAGGGGGGGGDGGE